MNKAKGRQSKAGDGHYKAQFAKTTANKLRRSKARLKKASSSKATVRAMLRTAANVNKGIPRPSTLKKWGSAGPKAGQKPKSADQIAQEFEVS